MYIEFELNDNTGRNPEYIFMYIKQYSVVGICDDIHVFVILLCDRSCVHVTQINTMYSSSGDSKSNPVVAEIMSKSVKIYISLITP
mgnify:CR=1 FL=1